MGDKISVIVPVYNVESYLEKCVKSILNQTYKNLEIILVNDGSTDNSGNICDELAKIDNRIVVYHKENGGLSDARNFGISKATSDYIGFIDSDDYIDLDMYETLYNLIQKYDADMSMCGHYDVYNNKVEKNVDEITSGKLTVKEAAKMVLEAKILSVTAVNKLYRKNLFDDLRYEIGKIAEDAFIILKIINKCKIISYTNEKKYYYVHRDNSITTQSFNTKYLDVIDAYNQNYNIVMKEYPDLEYQAKTRLIWAYFYVLDKLLIDKNYKDKVLEKKLKRFILKNNSFIIKNKLFTINRKMMLISLNLSTKIYKKILISKKI